MALDVLKSIVDINYDASIYYEVHSFLWAIRTRHVIILLGLGC